MFAFDFMCVPSVNTASGDGYPARSISLNIRQNIFSVVFSVYLCLKLWLMAENAIFVYSLQYNSSAVSVYMCKIHGNVCFP